MKNHIIDNSLKNLGKVVLWQYDRAYRLLSLLKHMQVLYHCSVEQFWEYWASKILSIDTCDAMGCSIWGIFLGIPRPLVKGADGTLHLIATEVYRRLLKGSFYLMKAGSSYQEILGYLEILFGIDGEDTLSDWVISVSEPGWTARIEEHGDSYFLQLYDPTFYCRKVGACPKDSLKISVSFALGETVITATGTRGRKCGIELVDNGNMSMSYKPSEFYDEMHADQKALFAQKEDEILPFPLGIKSNDFNDVVVFGFQHDPELANYEKTFLERRTLQEMISAGNWSETASPSTFPEVYLPPHIVDIDFVEGWNFPGTVEYQQGESINANTFIVKVIDYENTEAVTYYTKDTIKAVYYVKESIPASENTSFDVFKSLPQVQFVANLTYGNEPYAYQPHILLPMNLKFLYEGAIYQVKEYGVTAEMNRNFEAIQDKVVKVKEGSPAIGGMVDDDKPIFDMRKLQYPFRRITAETGFVSWFTLPGNGAVIVDIDDMLYVCKSSKTINTEIGYEVGKTGNASWEGSGNQWRIVFAEDTSTSDMLKELGRYCQARGFGIIPYSDAMSFGFDTTSCWAGTTIDVNGELRTFKALNDPNVYVPNKDTWMANNTYKMQDTVLYREET